VTSGAVAAPRCSEYARQLAEPLAGTAPVAAAWLVVEQPGPWGRDAPTSSHLDHALGAALAGRTEGLSVKVLLARRVGHHADHHGRPAPRNVWAAWTGGVTGLGARLEHAVLEDPRALLDLDLAGLAQGRPLGLGTLAESLALVCTNSRRDLCCALAGRPVAERLAERFPGRVWESSHVGGHRFAPTVVSLPLGAVHGGPEAADLALASCRGRAALDRPAQAAELAVLRARAAVAPYPLEVRPAGPGRWVVDPGGEPTLVAVHAERQLPARPESCGKEPVTPVAYRAEILGPLPAHPAR